MKNAQLLPHYDGSDNVSLSKKEQYTLQVAKNNSKLGKNNTAANEGLFNVAEQYGSDFITELQIMNRKKIKNNTVLDEFKQRREYVRNIKGEVDM